MGMDERHAVTINSTTTTAVGSIKGVLGGVRYVDEDEFGLKATEMLLTFPLDARTLISLWIKSIVLPIRNLPLTHNSVHNSTHPTCSPTSQLPVFTPSSCCSRCTVSMLSGPHLPLL
jgi:hypothetical protein